jgi:LPXTG-motif cell wall-anchored protein
MSRTRSLRVVAVTAAVAAGVLAAPFVAAPAASAVSPQEERVIVEMTPALHDEIQRMLEDFWRRNGIPGLTAAVVTSRPDDPRTPVITRFAVGTAIPGTPPDVDASTQFELGSETKVFTADLLAYLVATGQVHLDDPIEDYVPDGFTVQDWTDPDTGETVPVTLRDLATHQSGYPDLPSNFADGCGTPPPPDCDDPNPPTCDNPRPGYTQTMLWDELGCQPPAWRPGTQWLYSDFGFALLGAILANVVSASALTDAPDFQGALDGTFLQALGMSATVVEGLMPTPNLAPPYAGSTQTYLWDNDNAFVGGGGLVSTAQDMGTYVAAHLGYIAEDAPLGVRTMADTLTPLGAITVACQNPETPGGAPVCASGADFQMGLGWEIYPPQDSNVGATWAHKNGGTAGSTTDTVLAPSLRIGVTTMFNLQSSEEIATPILARLVAAQQVVERPMLPATGADASTPVALGGGAALLVAGTLLVTLRRRRDEVTAR